MFKKNSIFFRVLLPVVIVMLLQISLISQVLFFNGTIDAIKDSAVETMRKNAENRSITLENVIVNNWSNLDKLESAIISEIGGYLRDNTLSIYDALGSYEHETNLLYRISDSMIDALRLSSSTGVFIYFIDGEDYVEGDKTFNGLYYRDLDPVSTPADHSDILFLRGFIDIARKHMLQLDSLWSEAFTFTPENADTWATYARPLLAALEYPGVSSADLSYWSKPHLLQKESPLDTNKCITYTRPLIYNGRVVAMIGTEVQLEYLYKYFPSSDFNSSDKSGYMLLRYDQEAGANQTIDCSVYAVTGSYIKRIIETEKELTLAAGDRNNVYHIASKDAEDVQIVLQPLRIYNTNAPFSADQWTLAAIGADSTLFASANNVVSGIMYSSAVALLVGIVLLAVIIRLSTKPLIAIANQIEKSALDDPIVISNSNTYETMLLCSTINAMKERRRQMEGQLREERERYLIALESAADTFMEYDVKQDCFMLYYFSAENQKSELRSNVIESFTRKAHDDELFHPQDTRELLLFLNGQRGESVEIRVRTVLFPHITGTEPDGEYYWLLLKSVFLREDDGSLTKSIGIARDITKEKRREQARIETARRDSTTGLYNRDYGTSLLRQSIYSAAQSEVPFAVCMIRVVDFDLFEAYYGRVFGGVILMELSREFLAVTSEKDIPVRLSNDEFLFLFNGTVKQEAQARIDRINDGLAGLYTGENADLRLRIAAGIALSDGGTDFDDLTRRAGQALQYALNDGKAGAVYDDELPPDTQELAVVRRDKPVSVSLAVSKELIVGLVFELFERTSDIQSAILLLFSVLGRMYSLKQIIVCSYDADFRASRVAYQWNARGISAYSGNIEKVFRQDLDLLESLLNKDSALFYDDVTAAGYEEGVKQLLCILPGEQFSAYCCMMYENGVHTGRILFKSSEPGGKWSKADTNSLYEITKIIAAHLSIEKSNSASRAKSEFLSRMSHEIRTPMNAIIGMTEIAKNSMRDPERVGDCLDKIDYSSKHLLALINDVLEMSRIESGKLQIESESFSLDDLAAGIGILMRPPIEGKKVHFEIRNDTTHKQVIADEYRLKQVLVNLLGNANKFTEPGGTVTFLIEERDPPDDGFGYFRFSVRDSGIGIAQEDQPLIFKAFEQADSSTSLQRKQGTGLGLAISSNIIAAMGSKIELNSDLGEGSEFHFTLKLKLGEEKDAALPVEQEADIDYTADLSGKRALLVEDNEINIEIASYLLKDVGLQVDVAQNGQIGVDKFLASGQGFYDVILMDIQMPVMDGLTATREIRKNESHPDARTVPIIAMTANAFDEDMKRSIESGMSGHIAKPIDHEKLYALLRQLIWQED